MAQSKRAVPHVPKDPGEAVKSTITPPSIPLPPPARMPADGVRTRVFGVEYTHIKTADGGDLYVTQEGLPFIEHLKPESWRLEGWPSTILEGGTSYPKHVTTRAIDGQTMDLVLKHSRFREPAFLSVDRSMWHLLPDHYDLEDYAYYNPPFEEFEVLMDMRGSALRSDIKVLTQRPYAIYVPSAKVDTNRTEWSRSTFLSHEAAISRDQQKFPPERKVKLDFERDILLIYGWVKGTNAYDALTNLGMGGEEIGAFTNKVFHEVESKGFRVIDTKPIHFIVREKSQKNETLSGYRTIPGVTPEIAEALWNNGFRKESDFTLEHKRLMDVPGMTMEIAENCRKYPEQKALFQFQTIHGVDGVMAKKMWDSGITSFEDILTAKDQQLSELGMGEKLMQACRESARRRVIRELQRPYGVNNELATAIFDAGFRSVEMLGTVQVGDLMGIPGMTELAARNSKKYAEDKSKGEARWLLKDRYGEVAHALVDFEMLRRTSEYYRVNQEPARFYEALSRKTDADQGKKVNMTNILGVDYLYEYLHDGRRLWVVGSDPDLIGYFLPKRWEHTPRSQISDRTFRTESKDRVHMVCRISRVGQRPNVDPSTEDGREALQYGYNSPFEDIAIASDLLRKGFSVIRPRAILETAEIRHPRSDYVQSPNDRFKTHAGITDSVAGKPVIDPHHDYINIWSDWHGVDFQANYEKDSHWGALGADFARSRGLISGDQYQHLITHTRKSLLALGISGLPVQRLKGEHMLLKLDHEGMLKRTEKGFDVVLSTNLSTAAGTQLMSAEQVSELVSSYKKKLSDAGYVALDLHPRDLFISFSPDGRINADKDGQPLLTLVHFNLIRPKTPLLPM